MLFNIAMRYAVLQGYPLQYFVFISIFQWKTLENICPSAGNKHTTFSIWLVELVRWAPCRSTEIREIPKIPKKPKILLNILWNELKRDNWYSMGCSWTWQARNILQYYYMMMSCMYLLLPQQNTNTNNNPAIERYVKLFICSLIPNRVPALANEPRTKAVTTRHEFHLLHTIYNNETNINGSETNSNWTKYLYQEISSILIAWRNAFILKH